MFGEVLWAWRWQAQRGAPGVPQGRAGAGGRREVRREVEGPRGAPHLGLYAGVEGWSRSSCHALLLPSLPIPDFQFFGSEKSSHN